MEDLPISTEAMQRPVGNLDEFLSIDVNDIRQQKLESKRKLLILIFNTVVQNVDHRVRDKGAAMFKSAEELLIDHLEIKSNVTSCKATAAMDVG